jgi:hypothetical protein
MAQGKVAATLRESRKDEQDGIKLSVPAVFQGKNRVRANCFGFVGVPDGI